MQDRIPTHGYTPKRKAAIYAACKRCPAQDDSDYPYPCPCLDQLHCLGLYNLFVLIRATETRDVDTVTP